MLHTSKKVLAALAVSILLAPASFAALSNYSQDFEGLDAADGAALGNDGWLVFGNVFDGGGNFLYGYGPFSAPNGTPGFSSLAPGVGAGGSNQSVVIYSDYNNADHGVGNLIEANVFQEQIVDAADVGMTYEFTFDALLNDLVAPTTALAFIKTLDPNAGFATTNFLTLDMTNISNTDWTSFTIAITIDPGLAGQILQFGFASTATNFNASGVYYDNVAFTKVPLPGAVWLFGSALFGLFIQRRRAV